MFRALGVGHFYRATYRTLIPLPTLQSLSAFFSGVTWVTYKPLCCCVEHDSKKQPSIILAMLYWILFGGHPLKLEQYRED